MSSDDQRCYGELADRNALVFDRSELRLPGCQHGLANAVLSHLLSYRDSCRYIDRAS